MKRGVGIAKRIVAAGLLFALVSGLLQTGGSLSVRSEAAGHGLSSPRVRSKTLWSSEGGTLVWHAKWDCVYFGNYYQSNGKKKEPIKWRVLSVNGDDAFLLSEKALDFQAYHAIATEAAWEGTTLHTWLNESFYQAAFSENEKKAIKNNSLGKVFIPSVHDMTNKAYGFPIVGTVKIFADGTDTCWTRLAIPTAYVISLGAERDTSSDSFGAVEWWVRPINSKPTKAAVIKDMGNFAWAIERAKTSHISGIDEIDDYGSGPNDGLSRQRKLGVRPVLHLDLSSSLWKKAGTVAGGSWYNTKPSGRVKKLKIKNNKKKAVTVTWENSWDFGYQLQYSTNKKFKKKKLQTKNVKGISYYKRETMKTIVKKLKKKKTYYFRICGYRLDDKKKVYNKWSKVMRIKIKK